MKKCFEKEKIGSSIKNTEKKKNTKHLVNMFLNSFKDDFQGVQFQKIMVI